MVDALGTAVVLGLGGFYLGFMVWCTIGFRRLERRGSRARVDATAADGIEVSIVIPARNEVGQIAACVESVLASVLASASPSSHFEILVVDDGSDDGTSAFVATTFPEQLEQKIIRLLSTGEHGAGKQRALAVGVAAALGRFVLTTDADCTVAADWIEAMVSPLRAGATVVAGPVACRADGQESVFARMQELEVIGLVAVGAGSMANGSPTICNSANLGYTAEAYDAWKSESGHGSTPGADETLVIDAERLTGVAPVFVLDRAALVTAEPTRSLGAFIRQRVRWAAMGGRYPGFRVVAVSILVFCFYLSLLVAPFLGLWLAMLGGVVLKVAADGLLLFAATGYFGRRVLLRAMPFGQLLHAPYIVFAAAYGSMATIRWKGRDVG